MLSIAILSESPEQSWEIYKGLHPDMLRDVPDDVFSALLNHQLQADDSVKAKRLGELLALAAQCDMDPAALGRSLVEESLRGALTSAARQIRSPGGVRRAIDYKTMDWLWLSLKNLVGDDLSQVPLFIRREWLAVSAFRHRNDIPLIHRKLEEVIELGGGEGIDEQASRIVSMAKHRSTDLIESSLRLAAWCVARNINIRPLLISRTIGYLRQAWKAQGENGAERSQAAALALAAELRNGGADEAAALFEGVVQDIVRKTMPVKGRVQMLAETASSSTDDVYKVASGILRKDSAGSTELEALVKLCGLAMTKEGSPEPLIRRTVKQLASRPPERDDLVFALSDDVWSFMRSGGDLSPPLLTRLFELVLACPSSDDSHRAAYRLYPLVRAAEPPEQHRWLHSTAAPWNRLFAASVSRGQIFFASRLYADFQADGLAVPKPQLLRLIERIAATENVSRAILLDRHVKDYLWDEAPAADVIVAVVRGMATTGARSTVDALRLARRISPELPVAAIEAAVPVLAASSKRSRRALAFALLKELPTSEARRGYELVLSALVKNPRAAGLEPVLAVVHDMFARGIPAAERVSSLLASALLKHGELDAALALFRAAVARGAALSPGAVGQLMVRLAEESRCGDADEVERAWRALPGEHGHDGAVRGARLLVDMRAGRAVDLAVYDAEGGGTREHDGYRPNRHFLEFLKTRAPAPPAGALDAPAAAPAKAAPEAPRGVLGPGSQESLESQESQDAQDGQDAGNSARRPAAAEPVTSVVT